MAIICHRSNLLKYFVRLELGRSKESLTGLTRMGLASGPEGNDQFFFVTRKTSSIVVMPAATFFTASS